jgi:hypothetical protein
MRSTPRRQSGMAWIWGANQPLERTGRHNGVSCNYVLPTAPPLSFLVRGSGEDVVLCRELDTGSLGGRACRHARAIIDR